MDNRMKPKFVQLLIILLTLIMTGCWDQKIIEKNAFVVTLGLESVSEHELLFTVVTCQFDNRGGLRVKLITSRGNLIREGIRFGNLLLGGGMEHGKIEHVLFSQELAEQGIHPLLETFVRSRLLPLQSSLVVVEGSPNELLSKRDNLQSIFYLEQTVNRNDDQSYLFKTTIGDFEIGYFAPGIDPLLPIIKKTEEGIVVAGAALFKNDHMIGKLNPQQTVLLLAMMNRLHPTELFFKPQGIGKEEDLKKGVAVSISKASSKLGLKIRSHYPPELKISLHFIGRLQEYRWDHMDDKKKQNEMEQKLAKEIKESCLKLIRYTQQIGSDPIGFGDQVRAKYNSYWKLINWLQMYRDAKISVEVKFDLVHYGLNR